MGSEPQFGRKPYYFSEPLYRRSPWEKSEPQEQSIPYKQSEPIMLRNPYYISEPNPQRNPGYASEPKTNHFPIFFGTSFLTKPANNFMAIRTTGRNFYRTKTNAEDARRCGEVTVPRKNQAGHRIWINKRTKK